MSARWTEEDLSRFQRNSGRGLPGETLKEMQKHSGVKIDENGEPVPQAAPKTVAAAPGSKVKAAVAKKAKYHNQKTTVDGIKFDSKLEAGRYCELDLMRKAKAVTFFARQVPFPLPGGVLYRLDFLVIRPYIQGTSFVEYEDTKGHQTRESKNKIKQVEALYGIKITLVKKVRRVRSL